MSVEAQALAACADEPIRVPGAVQPHGVLLAVREPDLRVVVASDNAAAVLGSIPGTLAELLSASDLARLQAALPGDLLEVNPLRVHVGGGAVDVVLHRADGLLLTEWEPLPPSAVDAERRLPAVLQRMSTAATLEQLTGLLAGEVRALTGFDRVMVYRFDADWNGEVVAEERRDELDPFLGLHFPASDIPAQARALYATNWLRLIPDARYRPVPLSPARTPGTGQPLDLSGAMLRSVSPVHLEYLANMGVVASMSVSLMDRGRLWGLIACHHYSGPRQPSYTDRTAAEFLGRTASLLLHTLADAGTREDVVQVARREAALTAAVGRTPRTPLDALMGGDVDLADLLPCGGAAARLGGRLVLVGATPTPEAVAPLVQGLLTGGSPASSTLGVAEVADVASGLLAVEVGEGSGDFLAWFRPESLREVTWAGDPEGGKVVVDGDQGPQLHPRRSFVSWSETVRGTSAPWHDHEVAAARSLAGHVVGAALARSLEDDRLAATLQRTLLLEELPTLPGVALAARYRPSTDDVVGGDWYDLVPLPGGRLAVVLGDVAGHGLAAAAVTAQLRHALRAHLLRDLGPAGALSALNALVAALLPGELATVVVAELDPASGETVIASAGHLPVLHVRDGGAALLREGRGPALGLVDAAPFAEQRLRLSGQDRLLLYSDGLVERRGSDLGQGLDRLLVAATGAPTDADGLLEALLGALLPPDADDVTLLALGLTGLTG